MEKLKNWIIKQSENAWDWITDNYYLSTIIVCFIVGFIFGAIIF